MIKKINNKILETAVFLKHSSKDFMKDESGNGLIIGLLIAGILVLAVVLNVATITNFITGLTTYVTTFFDTEIKGVLN